MTFDSTVRRFVEEEVKDVDAYSAYIDYKILLTKLKDVLEDIDNEPIVKVNIFLDKNGEPVESISGRMHRHPLYCLSLKDSGLIVKKSGSELSVIKMDRVYRIDFDYDSYRGAEAADDLVSMIEHILDGYSVDISDFNENLRTVHKLLKSYKEIKESTSNIIYYTNSNEWTDMYRYC